MICNSSVSVDSWSAFLWDDGDLIDLGDLGWANTSGLALNDSAQVVGISHLSRYDGHAFLWDDSRMIDLGPRDAPYSIAWDINAAGQVVGKSYDPTVSGFLYY